MITVEQLQKILTGNTHIKEWCDALNKFFPTYGINSIKEQAAFIAQCAHESRNFTALQEDLHYSAASLTRVWPQRFPPAIAAQYAMNPEKIANRAYGGRLGNGPEETGEGWKYRGQGLIQLTGKSNQENFAKTIGKKIEDMPAYLATFDGAVESACWFWKTHNLNTLAQSDNIDAISKAINGGTIGLEERRKNYNKILPILSA